jgi:hypothetical protein
MYLPKNFTMIRILYLALFCGLIKAISAQKCEVKKDAITGEKVITVNYDDRWVYMESKNGIISLQLSYNYSGQMDTSIPKGTEVSVKLKNDEVLKLITSAETLPKRLPLGTRYTYEFILDKATISKFAASPPVFIRLADLKAGSYEIAPNDYTEKKSLKVIEKGSKFILENS